MKNRYDICIVGGGPSGLAAAIEAAHNGAGVLILESGPSPGRKLLATGSGRCNLTHAGTIESFLQGFDMRAARFLKPSMYHFTVDDTISYFEALGVPLKIERGSRVFPVSERSHDVLNALIGEIKRTGIELRVSAAVRSINRKAEGFEIVCHQGMVYAKSVLIATGGLSMKRSGSTGDGYRFAERLGHTVNEPRASLVPLITVEKWPEEIKELTLKHVCLHAFIGKKRFERFGEMLFTPCGIGGPITLEMSRLVTDTLFQGKGPIRFVIDLKPALDEKKLDARLIRELESNPKRKFIKVLHSLVPALLAGVIVKHFSFDGAIIAGHVPRAERIRLRQLLKALPLTVVATAPIEEALVTRGGVELSEIDARTLMSKRCEGLYFAGEVMDVDGDCGGYNLQMCWSTGKRAGFSAAKYALHHSPAR
jgi:hypothetical protein